jgi:hypothetical protein
MRRVPTRSRPLVPDLTSRLTQRGEALQAPLTDDLPGRLRAAMLATLADAACWAATANPVLDGLQCR